MRPIRQLGISERLRKHKSIEWGKASLGGKILLEEEREAEIEKGATRIYEKD